MVVAWEKPVMGDLLRRSDLWIEWLEFRRWMGYKKHKKKREVRWHQGFWPEQLQECEAMVGGQREPFREEIRLSILDTSTLRYLFAQRLLGGNPEDTRLEFRASSGWRYKSIPFFKLGHYLFIFNSFLNWILIALQCCVSFYNSVN